MFDETSLDAFAAFNNEEQTQTNEGTHAFIVFKFSENCLSTTKQIPEAFVFLILK